MFGLFSCKPPLSTRQRGELELLLRKCVQRVSEPTIREATVIGQWSDLALDLGEPESLLVTAAVEVRQRMKLTDDNVQLEISDQITLEGAARYLHGGPPVISVAMETLQDPLRTVTALAHEYGHHVLLCDTTHAADYDERLADLLPLCYGFGVLQSDASLYFRNWSMGEWSGHQASKQGYLNAQEIGYALALFARVRGEANPTWKRGLRADSKVTMNQAQKYFRLIQKSDRSLLFDADRIPGTESTSRELAGWLSGSDPTFALAAGWRLCAMDRFDGATIQALHAATHSSDPDLVPLVIGLLAGADDQDRETLECVRALLRDRRPQVALAAVKAACGLGLGLEGHIGVLAWLLDKYEHHPREVLQLIAAQGEAAASIDANLCRMLPRALKSVDDETTEALLDCLQKISNDPKQSIESSISPGPIRDELMQWLRR